MNRIRSEFVDHDSAVADVVVRDEPDDEDEEEGDDDEDEDEDDGNQDGYSE